MSKKAIAATIALTTVLAAPVVWSAAGTVNFAGNILDAACDIDVASQNQVVVLGDYARTEFVTAGSKTVKTRFDIVLKNCPESVTTAKVRFDGTPDATNANLLAVDNSVAGAATGVAINLMTADQSDLPLNGSNSYVYALSSTADNKLNFYAQYISTAASVTAGPANSVANFSVVYN